MLCRHFGDGRPETVLGGSRSGEAGGHPDEADGGVTSQQSRGAAERHVAGGRESRSPPAPRQAMLLASAARAPRFRRQAKRRLRPCGVGRNRVLASLTAAAAADVTTFTCLHLRRIRLCGRDRQRMWWPHGGSPLLDGEALDCRWKAGPPMMGAVLHGAGETVANR
ncbi:hypothetical protein GCM10022206_17820 [Streptomyces chiangmaiensis]